MDGPIGLSSHADRESPRRSQPIMYFDWLGPIRLQIHILWSGYKLYVIIVTYIVNDSIEIRMRRICREGEILRNANEVLHRMPTLRFHRFIYSEIVVFANNGYMMRRASCSVRFTKPYMSSSTKRRKPKEKKMKSWSLQNFSQTRLIDF